MATDNVVLNKTATMERCINRVLEEYRGFEAEFSKIALQSQK